MAGAWSGLISLAWYRYFDFNLQSPANLFYFAMLIGIVQSGWVGGGRRKCLRSHHGGLGVALRVERQMMGVGSQGSEDWQTKK